ncbi:hypothetical protein [Rodentibacter trehalosifermentans]|uniref:Uncharacterized protein n=1 Tax=Rodentibacter trehalosifermentans TaxID=1908263 RepID=A0A1V3IXD4_9PAST|nr:hypothetical protein [Rodentibacter trehalosifermentans]OOF46164.1 hypothetical protein BKK51_03045 [Rodentibacter trehalosifermentans]OOF46901.1 hypothetical protein BKK52_10340 [Rodentibacter trehalosifermentans]OOF53903.1 hypothetical protein BKK53_00185 [Rodentibacter trehalosifermentans]
MMPTLLLITYLVLHIVATNLSLVYPKLEHSFIGKPISHIEDFLNQEYTFDFTMKGFVGFPYKAYKTGCGKGYALTVFLNQDKIVQDITNEVFYECNDIKLLRKRIYTSEKGMDTEITVYPFI